MPQPQSIVELSRSIGRPAKNTYRNLTMRQYIKSKSHINVKVLQIASKHNWRTRSDKLSISLGVLAEGQ
jgi:hypothetical protein